jgi:hypothetical protein
MRRLLIALAIALLPSMALAHSGGGGGGRRFVHRHGRVFSVGGGPWWVGGYDACWQWIPTSWGPRRVWACDYY